MIKNQKSKIKNQKSKGVALYLALMIMTVLLALALGVSAILFGQMKMMREMENSVLAFYAADTGIEGILYQDKCCRQPICSTSSPPAFCTPTCTGLPDGYSTTTVLENQATYQAEYLIGPPITIKSVGIYKETKRAIQVTR